MTAARQIVLARAGALAAAAIVIVSAAVLVADFGRARYRLPRDDARVAELQAQARTDSSAARTLDAEQEAITKARLARRGRLDAFGLVLIASSALFIGCSKWQIALGPRRPVAPPAPAHRVIRLRRLQEAPIRYRITDACNGCTLCVQACRTSAIGYRPYEKHEIDDSRCTWCDKCVGVCPEGAIEVVFAVTGAPAPRPTRPRPLAS